MAVTGDNIIGANNQLPWSKQVGDLKLFKLITINHPVIMGYKTFHSMKCQSLVGRKNIVITSKKNLHNQINLTAENEVHYTSNFLKLINDYQNASHLFFIIGGASIYQLFYQAASYLYLTTMNKNYPGDCKLEQLNLNHWQQITSAKFENFKIVVYKKNNHVIST